ncbi:precorrin-3B C(17)-methyltransferase [Burkholderia cenocepacia]|jgi:cobalt-precorrin 5A hydrolase/precorrin-3B C17-methyltransferase|uniref:precorrin-3B C(17)-methyltransferase n=1 Tax=Burkholderia cenocepacia TaxID=95486 RepID=UPI0004F846B0|nr:precorrin-3B C(17)-methyltransferase [Burkholderia cenocepacia]AIO49135.1 precorrin-3B C17-methyltransferase [Burkholderia cepacia]KGB94250.1 precorrin-3B C17-methyltransferase [Burkholderia cepacia]MCW3522259.1 precorrin-3B C(17)-methyltransferase [Burkholderia cenocepacia]MCW3613745.1 precorrin-3B C(17)-methyltransferase [Burkholderia cenocepacia]MCW3651880.1 precorrin-3B C(17)-methyltransferase [Burkholderia cenocepacia]
MMTPPAIVILGAGALDTARRIQARYPGARVHGLASRVDADVPFDELGAHLRELYARGLPIVALCAAGIVIRCLAPALADKGVEPPVLAVAEDGSAVVPLLGGLTGVNVIAREIAECVGVAPAITTSGELRFGACVLNPPEGYALADLAQGKRFVSDLLAGASTRIDGAAPWLDDVALPRDAAAAHAIRVTPDAWRGARDELVIHPRSVVIGVAADAVHAGEALAARIDAMLDAQGLARLALAAIVAPASAIGDAALEAAASTLDVPLRFVDSDRDGNAAADAATLLGRALRVAHTLRGESHGLACAVASQPVDPATLGRARGRLTVLGLGPGAAAWLTPAARAALADATDILGYTTYVNMAGPFRADQRVHGTDNREEMQRARHAFELAAEGRRVAVVSSGDPGVFAMAAAVLEALDEARDPQWAAVDLRVEPGISASLATAAQAGAPLGHDFCAISLSDNLKPWAVIETRLQHAAQADLVMAFYNPISRARPWQLDRALDIVRAHRAADTVVVLGRDIGRPGATLATTTLGALRSDQVDMRTMVIVGSSTTRRFAIGNAREWVYTPRWYR